MAVNIEASEQCVEIASKEIGNGNIEKAEKLLNKVRKKFFLKEWRNFIKKNSFVKFLQIFIFLNNQSL